MSEQETSAALSTFRCECCGNQTEEEDLRTCPFCDGAKCPLCDIGDDVRCLQCENILDSNK